MYFTCSNHSNHNTWVFFHSIYRMYSNYSTFLCTCFPVCFILGFVKEKYQSDMIYETKQIELMTSHKMCHVASFCVIVKS